MRARSLVLALLVSMPVTASAQGQIIVDFFAVAPNTGFADPTPVAPVGGNPGTTLGQQRIFVFLQAAAIWTEALRPKVDVFVAAQFEPLGANVLGSAGTVAIFRDFPGAELPGTWYHSALADHLAGVDLDPTLYDIVTRFSSDAPFYLGFDNAEGPGQSDLLPVVLHELGHGLGFANFVNEAAGTLALGFPDIYSQYTLDTTTDRNWNVMTVPERQASALNVRKVAWSGINVNRETGRVLSPGEATLRVDAPAPVRFLMVGEASFGAPLQALGSGVSGELVLAQDDANAAGPSTTDACTPITNAAEVANKIALVDRGTCGFVVKVKNAQNAGAIAVVVADNAAGSPPAGLGGADPTITISSVRVTLADGNTLKAALPGVRVSLGLDLSVLAGTDREEGLMLVAAFNPVVAGSSISHFDAVARRNQLMEPAINNDLTSSVRPPEDLTLPQMTDVGWFSDADGVPDGVDACIGSDVRPTVIVGGANTGVPNAVLATGCTIGDLVAQCLAGASNHGGFASCVAHLTNALRDGGVISGAQKGAIQRAAARAR